MPTLTIDGRTVEVREGAYILEAAKAVGVHIPTLCQFDGLEPWGGCRLCVVDMWRPGWDDDWFKMVTACNHPAEDGIKVFTATDRVMATRRVVLDLLLARCPKTLLIQSLASEHGIETTTYRPNPEPTDCILCGLCTRVCDHIGVSAIASVDRGSGREVAPPFHQPPPDCIGCLACAEICPTACIPYSTSSMRREIWDREFEMLRCAHCGRAHITVAQADYYADRNGVPRSYFETCDACKRAQQAVNFVKLSQVG
jgi:NADH dehydrogenase/NADH:ubiquinone oxidoreductase subunit G